MITRRRSISPTRHTLITHRPLLLIAVLLTTLFCQHAGAQTDTFYVSTSGNDVNAGTKRLILVKQSTNTLFDLPKGIATGESGSNVPAIALK
ncbi:MAG: hypothetical protein HY033_12535 [Ignavibacteriae bacterium]|nr:hypothetical protein [Ignavibacteria bacterium]MBI3365720.1 hypothetical protein [Ignavibacteriota bacterium]